MSRKGNALEEAVEGFRATLSADQTAEVMHTEGTDDMAVVIVWIPIHDSLIYVGTWHVFDTGTWQQVHSSA